MLKISAKSNKPALIRTFWRPSVNTCEPKAATVENSSITCRHVGSCVLKASVDRVSVDTLGRHVGRVSADISTDTQSICRPSVGRHVVRISFCFCVTDLGFEKRTSVKKPCSVTVCTVGKLSSVDVQVTSSVLTVPGIRKPTSLYKPYRVTVIWPRFGVVTKPCSFST